MTTGSQRQALGRRKPTVWIFNHYAGFPETVPATRTFELSRELVRHGWDVTVIACSFNHYTFTDDLGPADPVVHESWREGVRWVRIKSHPYAANGVNRLRNMVQYCWRARAWSRRRPAPDVVVGTTVHPFAADTARRIARGRGAAFVYEITDLWPESLVDLGSLSRSSSTYRLMSRLERLALAGSDGVIGLMSGVPDYARDRYSINLGSFAYIPNGMRLRPDGSDEPVSPKRGHVAYAGGFARAHGMESVVEAATILYRTHPGVTLHLYGDGLERTKLEQQTRAQRLPNIVFHGLVPKAEVRDRLRAAEVCLCTGQSLPVHRYGISFNKLFDYFEAARPVIFAVNSGNDPVAHSGAGLSVPAGDAPALAAAIADLCLRSPEELQEMGRLGAEFLRKEHDFDLLGQRLDGYLRRHLRHGH